jgi:hypothetical protein
LQLALFRFVCTNPNGFLFAGDTAQTISAASGFRFEDVRSLFFHEYKPHLCSDTDVPPVLHLHQNYRTHASVLNLASTVIEALVELFPEMVDKLPQENALFFGPKPLFLGPTDLDELMIKLFGDSKSMPQEFGAQQAVIVRTEASRDCLLDLLPSALILTVQESKGLEFEDILIFNFFHDSEFSSWRILYKVFPDAKNAQEPIPDFDKRRFQLLCNELKSECIFEL